MMDFLGVTAIILGGLLRVLPAPTDSISVKRKVSSTERVLSLAQEHIRAGRLQVLDDSTKSGLIEKAKQYEMQTLRPEARSGSREPQQLFFD